jgi:hypothetical protein
MRLSHVALSTGSLPKYSEDRNHFTSIFNQFITIKKLLLYRVESEHSNGRSSVKGSKAFVFAILMGFDFQEAR